MPYCPYKTDNIETECLTVLIKLTIIETECLIVLIKLTPLKYRIDCKAQTITYFS